MERLEYLVEEGFIDRGTARVLELTRGSVVLRDDAEYNRVLLGKPTCRSCGYDVDDDGYCAFCGGVTLDDALR